MACVAGMGFAVDDCRDAVQAGKLTVEAAVEWLVTWLFLYFSLLLLQNNISIT